MDGARNHMCRVLTEKLLQKKDVNMFERMKISETIYKGVIEYPYLKTLIYNIINFLVEAGN